MRLRNLGVAVLLGTAALAGALEPQNPPEKAFLDYVDATRTKNLSVLDRFIAEDSMTLNGQNKVADKQSELAETKTIHISTSCRSATCTHMW